MKLTFEHVCKTYGREKALKDLSFAIEEPGIYGLLGSNGAGKSTTIRLALNQIERTSGRITVDDVDVRQLKPTQNLFAYIPDEPIYYEELTVREHFEFIAGIYKQNADISSLVKRLELEPHLNKMPDALSKGTRQKLSIGCALLRSFDILLADEPFTGLDPRQIAMFKLILKELTVQGKIVILSTHLLRMVDSNCKKLIVLHHGELKGFGTLQELKAKCGLPSNASIEDVYFSLTGEEIENETDAFDGDDDDVEDDEVSCKKSISIL